MNQLRPLMSYLRSCIRFNGRASRSEYWRVMRFVLLIPVVLFVVVIIASLLETSAILGGSFISAVYSPLLVLVLSPFWLAVTVRRLHDIDHSAIWLLAYLVIILGWVAVAGTAVSYGVIIGAENPQDGPAGRNTGGSTHWLTYRASSILAHQRLRARK